MLRLSSFFILGTFICSSYISASNLAFWHNIELSSTGMTNGVYWISLPYRYTPPDFNTNGIVDSEDLVQDFQPIETGRPCTAAESNCAIERVWAWEPATGEYNYWVGGDSSGSPFELTPGTAYGIEIQSVGLQAEHILAIVGAHERSYEHSDCYEQGAINLRWISLPPHLAIGSSFGIPDVIDAEDLGQALGGAEHIYQLRRVNENTGNMENWVVGSQYGTPFEIDLSAGYAIDLTCSDISQPCSQCRWSWIPPVY